MTASPIPMNDPALAALEGWAAPLPLGVAYSGGADSTALLHAAARLWPGQVKALHVHHGLQAAADAFVRHCEATCLALKVPLAVLHVDARHAPGESPEDAARGARYQALAELAMQQGLTHVALAQHADDQVETLLIALGRGGGVEGLAGMPAQMRRHGICFHRPLLGVCAADLRDWLHRSRTSFVEDPSNDDLRFTRNRIRKLLLPALQQTMPQFRETFARSARNAARAALLLSELAGDDQVATGTPPRLDALRNMPRERRGNLLRHWLKQVHLTTPSEAQLAQLQDQIEACSTRGHRIRLKVGTGFVVREGEVLRWYNAPPAA